MGRAGVEVLELLDHAWTRLGNRLAGLSDREWRWQPIDGEPRLSIHWRLGHLRNLFESDRTWACLGMTDELHEVAEQPRSAAQSVAAVTSAYKQLFAALEHHVEQLPLEVGPAGGRYASATRFAFLLHVADELIHHAAEVGQLRDLYAAERHPRVPELGRHVLAVEAQPRESEEDRDIDQGQAGAADHVVPTDR